MRKLVLFLVLGVAIGGAALWHFTRQGEGEELKTLSTDPKDWDPSTLRDTQGEIVVGGGPATPLPAEKPKEVAKEALKETPAVSATPASSTKEKALPELKTSTPVAGEENYTVKNGDTLGDIAKRKYGSSAPRYVDAIVKKNSLKSAHSLKIGMKLILPDSTTIKSR